MEIKNEGQVSYNKKLILSTSNQISCTFIGCPLNMNFLARGPINITYCTIFKMLKALQSNQSSEIQRNNWLLQTTNVKEMHYQVF